MYSVEHGISSSTAVEGLLKLVDAKTPILDVTYGNGTFWKGSSYPVWGMDLEPERAKTFVASFFALPFDDSTVETVVYDPPFHPYVGSAEEQRFKGMGTDVKSLKSLFQKGVEECWRVTKQHLLVKCQGYIHNHCPQWMPLWAIEVCGEPFEWLVVSRGHKRISGRWLKTLSLRRNHADYLLFSKMGNKR